MLIRIIGLLFAVVALSYCDSESSQQREVPWANGTMFRLEGSNDKLYLPTGFKASSRYRLQQDLSIFSPDSADLRQLQDFLEGLEFNAGQEHVFVDTLTGGIFFMKEVARIPIHTNSALTLKLMVQQSLEKAVETGQLTNYEKIATKIQQNNHGGLISLRYALKVADRAEPNYRSLYIFSNSAKTYQCIGSNATPLDVGPYLWSLAH